MRVAIDAALESGGICEAAICYTGDILDDARPKYSLKYYVTMAKQLEKLGAHFLCIKDMAGLCKPYAAYELVKALQEEIEIPIHFHTHDTSGLNAASVLKASEAGVDIADAAMAVDERRHEPAQSQLDRRSAAPHAARHEARHRHAQRVLRLLGSRAHLLHAVRLRTESRLRAPLSARNSRRPIHEFARTSRRHGPRPPLARSRNHVRRGQSAFRRHRQSHAIQQSRRRHDAVPDGERHAPGRHSRARREARSLAAELRRRNVHRSSRRSSGRLAEEIAENYFARRAADQRPLQRQHASR